MKNLTYLIITLLLLSGCCRERNKQTISHWSGWSDQSIELAGHAWLYSQLANNVYKDKDKFKLPKHISSLNSFSASDGFYSEVFKDSINNQYIFVIRGTENGLDWIKGNFPIIETQCNSGLKFYDKCLGDYKIASMIVAGHSLGGGIATHISLNRNVIKSYSFNGSPVFKRLGNEFDNDRFSIVEHGEALKIARVFGPEATQLYTSIGLTSGGSLSQHKIEPLATGLTQIAAIRDIKAKQSLIENKIDDKWGGEN